MYFNQIYLLSCAVVLILKKIGFKNLVKLILTTIALFFVFYKIDISSFSKSLANSNIYGLIAALIVFNISKIIAAFRLLRFYEMAGVQLNASSNLMFYYLGMFYNLFLPGSVSGDAYKVYLLKQNQQNLSLKNLISASLLDRMSGVSFLFVMAAIFLSLSSFDLPILDLDLYLWIMALLIIPCYYLVVRVFFSGFVSGFMITGIYSFFVQAGQVICATFILLALDIQIHLWDYLTLFMISSVIAILPLTVGGFGARELVFLFGSRFMHVNESMSIAFTVSFFVISAVSSLIGLFFIKGIDKKLLPNLHMP